MATPLSDCKRLIEIDTQLRKEVGELFELGEQGALVNRRSRRVFPVVESRMRVADGLARQLQALGLERRKPLAPALEDYVREKFGSARGAEHNRQAEGAPR